MRVSVRLTGGDANAGAWVRQAAAVPEKMRAPESLLNRLVDSVFLPELGRNYFASGLKSHSGLLYRGITERGAQGNYVVVSGSSVRVGVDYQQLPYARFALEGRGPVEARRARALRFVVDGQVIYRRSVGPAPAHDVYRVTPDMLAKALAETAKYLEEDS